MTMTDLQKELRAAFLAVWTQWVMAKDVSPKMMRRLKEAIEAITE